ncbi:hypothetical protein QN277_013010 [Acacia crassicarpa]|uniref:Uncharacterized protein n=1 Tax=Acacia crassicarpa TaxID=499986 RepID=A0AAE1N2U2_9FABA|nr:hypothetical protein QN277_013010 [Acacia crassicarpa]
MEEEEHEVYGGDIPDMGEMEGDLDSHHAYVDMSATDDDAVNFQDRQRRSSQWEKQIRGGQFSNRSRRKSLFELKTGRPRERE